MEKTDKQLMLEAQRGKDLPDIIREVLENHRGAKHLVQRAAIDLNISGATLWIWCNDHDISIDDYKQHRVSPEAPVA